MQYANRKTEEVKGKGKAERMRLKWAKNTTILPIRIKPLSSIIMTDYVRLLI
jgi:hypothetical protein